MAHVRAGDGFQFTRSSRSATVGAGGKLDPEIVSIHALLAERDTWTVSVNGRTFSVSIHALLAERDISPRGSTCSLTEFQFTRSSRSATEAR